MVVVFYAFNCFVNVGGVGLLRRVDFRCRRLCDAIPSETNWLALVQQWCVVLILIHHLVEAENGSQIDDLFLGGVSECPLVLVTQVDSDLFFCLLHSFALRWRDIFLTANCSSNKRLQIGNIWCFDCLLVDVVDQFLAIKWTGWWFWTFIAVTLVWWQEWILQRGEKIRRGRGWLCSFNLHRDQLLSLRLKFPLLTIALEARRRRCHHIHSDLYHIILLASSWSKILSKMLSEKTRSGN